MSVQPLIMPKLGAYTDDVLLARWLVSEGEQVAAGEPVFELETEKTTAEVEAEMSGFVHHLVAAGATVPIGTTVALVAETPEEYRKARLGASKEQEGDGNPFLGYIASGGGMATASAPAAPAVAASRGEPPRAAEPAPSDSRPATPLVSPRARALLKQFGLTLDDAREITASGPGGRIVDRDVAAWAAARSAKLPPATATGLTIRSTIPLRGRRGTIATRMVASLQTAAQLTSVLEIDVKPLVELRAALNAGGATPRIGVTAIVVKLVAAALREHPLLNSRVSDAGIELLAEINIAVAVETPEGLVAPVVAGADRLSVEEINAGIADLSARARDRALGLGDLADGTFTVSNGGIHPVDLTTAILNPPQCGILWIGRIRQRPLVVPGGAIAIRPTLQACLTFDHRAIDGGPAAAFLGTFERLVADLPRLPS